MKKLSSIKIKSIITTCRFWGTQGREFKTSWRFGRDFSEDWTTFFIIFLFYFIYLFWCKGYVRHTFRCLSFSFYSSWKHNSPQKLPSVVFTRKGHCPWALEQPWQHRQLWTGGLRISKKGREHPATQISWIILGVTGPPSISQMVFKPPWCNCALEVMLADLFSLPIPDWFLISKLLVSGIF